MSLLLTFTLTLIGIATLALVTLATLVQTKQFLKLAIAAPILLAAGTFTLISIDGVRGWPAQSPPNDFTLLHYHTDGQKIWIWVMDPHLFKPRTYEFPHSASFQRELQKATEESGAGGGGRLSRGEESGAPYVHHQFRMDKLPDKPRQ